MNPGDVKWGLQHLSEGDKKSTFIQLETQGQ